MHPCKAFLAFFVVLLVPVMASAQPADSPGTSDFDRLGQATSFQPAGVSIDGHRSHFLFSLDRLTAGNDAEAKLERLYAHAQTIDGKLYALVGLFHVNRLRYRQLASRLDGAIRVRAQLGCMGAPIELREALEMINRDQVAFRSS